MAEKKKSFVWEHFAVVENHPRATSDIWFVKCQHKHCAGSNSTFRIFYPIFIFLIPISLFFTAKGVYQQRKGGKNGTSALRAHLKRRHKIYPPEDETSTNASTNASS
jgi:hypothetical protein